MLLSGRRSIYFYMILKVGKWPGSGLLTYSLAWTEVGMCRQVPLCKALHWGTSSSLINILTNQFNEMWSTSRPSTLDCYNLPTFSIFIVNRPSSRTRLQRLCSNPSIQYTYTAHISSYNAPRLFFLRQSSGQMSKKIQNCKNYRNTISQAN